MADLITMLSAVAGQQGEEADEDFNQTVLLLHGDGTNGAQNNTFLDSSTNNFTITRNGNTTQGTFSPFSLAAGEWSNFFDGTGDYFEIPDNVALRPETSNFTIEAWVYRAVADVAHTIFAKGSPTGPTGFFFTIATTNTLQFTNVSTNINSTGTIPVGVWTHVAVVREGTGTDQLKLYINGVQDGQGTVSTNFNQTNVARIGANRASVSFFNGYISNFRFVKGTAVYTSNFTPSTTPLTAITDTSLLTCQSNRLIDNSTNNFTLNRFGDVRVTPFSPFAPTAAYSAGTNGGSGYFDGNGDYLTAAASADFDLGGGDFTVEGWFYVLSTTANPHFFQFSTSGTNRWNVYRDTNFYIFSAISGVNTTSNTGDSVPLNQWFHLAVVKSSTTTKIYLNGAEIYSDGRSYPTGNMQLSIGFQENGGLAADYLTGWVSSFRVVKGTAVYTAAFTPPTAPLTAITNTELLLNFTNAGIIDNTGKNVLETVGNAQIDTAVKKYGTGSLEFDGTGDWLLMPNTVDQQLGTGNFTIEFWVYLASGDTGSARGLVAKGGASTGWLVSLDSSQKVVFTYTTSTITSSGAITTNAWNHIAVVRSGTGSNQTKIYIGGTNDGTGTVSTDFNQTESMYVGANRTGGDPMKGFIDDLRITKGVARYTANFTPPTKAFPDQ